MLGSLKIRTDLALEAREMCEGEGELRGVIVEEEEDPVMEIHTTTVVIESENGAKAMGKPVGTYITLEVPKMAEEDEDYHREISMKIAEHLRKLSGEETKSVLIAGLGNRDVTPDALGPRVVSNIYITRHLVKEYGQSFLGNDHQMISAIAPGVMAQTGMETLEILRGVVKETMPDVVIVIDALAARSTKRLNRTIQITDAGINPGSGVGNHRNAINKETMGIPVIALGVPTVVDAATIVCDIMGEILEDNERKQGLREKMSPALNTMFVTPKNIDEDIKRISFTISEGLNSYCLRTFQ
ncbi:MAG: GPR endopeptidase [Muricoprocola sp.]